MFFIEILSFSQVTETIGFFSHTNPYILNVTQQCRCSPMLIFRAWATCGNSLSRRHLPPSPNSLGGKCILNGRAEIYEISIQGLKNISRVRPATSKIFFKTGGEISYGQFQELITPNSSLALWDILRVTTIFLVLAFLYFNETVPVFIESQQMSVKIGEISCTYFLRNREKILSGP